MVVPEEVTQLHAWVETPLWPEFQSTMERRLLPTWSFKRLLDSPAAANNKVWARWTWLANPYEICWYTYLTTPAATAIIALDTWSQQSMINLEDLVLQLTTPSLIPRAIFFTNNALFVVHNAPSKVRTRPLAPIGGLQWLNSTTSYANSHRTPNPTKEVPAIIDLHTNGSSLGRWLVVFVVVWCAAWNVQTKSSSPQRLQVRFSENCLSESSPKPKSLEAALDLFTDQVGRIRRGGSSYRYVIVDAV